MDFRETEVPEYATVQRHFLIWMIKSSRKLRDNHWKRQDENWIFQWESSRLVKWRRNSSGRLVTDPTINTKVSMTQKSTSLLERLDRHLIERTWNRTAGKGFKSWSDSHLAYTFIPILQAMGIHRCFCIFGSRMGKARQNTSIANDQSNVLKVKVIQETQKFPIYYAYGHPTRMSKTSRRWSIRVHPWMEFSAKFTKDSEVSVHVCGYVSQHGQTSILPRFLSDDICKDVHLQFSSGKKTARLGLIDFSSKMKNIFSLRDQRHYEYLYCT